jgi:hypothetical protein
LVTGHGPDNLSMISTVGRCLALFALCATPLLGGCAAAMVGGAVVAGAVSVTSAVVVTGVELTGKAVGAGIDAMAAPKEPKPDGATQVAAIPALPVAETTAVSSSQPVAPTPLEPRPVQ